MGVSVAGESAAQQYEQRRLGRRERVSRSWPAIAALIGVAFVAGWLFPIVLLSALKSGIESVAAGAPTFTVEAPPLVASAVFGAMLAVKTAMRELAPSRSEVAWGKGAAGERIVGRALDALGEHGAHVLHDRRIPGSRANIDHLVVAPTGVFTVDAKRYSGKLEVRSRGKQLWIKGRNRSKLLDQAHRQADVVTRTLTEAGFPDVTAQPVLCFVNTQFPLLFAPRQAAGVTLCRAREVRRRLIDKGLATIRADDVRSITAALDAALAPAAMGPAISPEAAVHAPGDEEAPAPSRTCRCGQAMILRTRRSDGARFYGCSSYPRCRHTQPLDSV